MAWKKLDETEDLLSYEKKNEDIKIRIEARLVDGRWTVFKTYFNEQGNRFVEEFNVPDRNVLNDFLIDLQKEKDLTVKDIEKIKEMQEKDLKLKVKRDYKEDYVEKWMFGIGKDPTTNFISIRFDNCIRGDIVLHSRYRYLEKKITKNLIEMLGLKEMSESIELNIYYFKNNLHYKSSNPKNIVVEVGFKEE